MELLHGDVIRVISQYLKGVDLFAFKISCKKMNGDIPKGPFKIEITQNNYLHALCTPGKHTLMIKTFKIDFKNVFRFPFRFIKHFTLDYGCTQNTHELSEPLVIIGDSLPNLEVLILVKCKIPLAIEIFQKYEKLRVMQIYTECSVSIKQNRDIQSIEVYFKGKSNLKYGIRPNTGDKRGIMNRDNDGNYIWVLQEDGYVTKSYIYSKVTELFC